MLFSRKKNRRRRAAASGRFFRRRPSRRKPKIDLGTEKLLVSKIKTKSSLYLYRASVLVVIVGLFYLIFFTSLFTVDKVLITGETETKQDAILAEINPILNKRPLGIFPANHLFFISEKKIQQTLLEKFKSFEAVRVNRQFFNQLEIEIKQKNTLVLLCGTDQCASLDYQGAALNHVAKTEIPRYGSIVEVVTDESNSNIELGQGIMSEEQIDFILNLRSETEQKLNLKLTDLFMPLPSASEIKAKTDEQWLIYFNPQKTLKSQLTALEVVLGQEIPEEDKICVEYIDLRIPKKVYYKLVDDCPNVKKQREEEQKRKEEEAEKQQKEAEERQKEEEKKQKEAEKEEAKKSAAEAKEKEANKAEPAAETAKNQEEQAAEAVQGNESSW